MLVTINKVWNVNVLDHLRFLDKNWMKYQWTSSELFSILTQGNWTLVCTIEMYRKKYQTSSFGFFLHFWLLFVKVTKIRKYHWRENTKQDQKNNLVLKPILQNATVCHFKKNLISTLCFFLKDVVLIWHQKLWCVWCQSKTSRSFKKT